MKWARCKDSKKQRHISWTHSSISIRGSKANHYKHRYYIEFSICFSLVRHGNGYFFFLDMSLCTWWYLTLIIMQLKLLWSQPYSSYFGLTLQFSCIAKPLIISKRRTNILSSSASNSSLFSLWPSTLSYSSAFLARNHVLLGRFVY